MKKIMLIAFICVLGACMNPSTTNSTTNVEDVADSIRTVQDSIDVAENIDSMYPFRDEVIDDIVIVGVLD
jgi:hypothetical protein